MKKKLIILLSIGAILLFASFTGNKSTEENSVEQMRAVKVIQVEEKENNATLEYLGTVTSKEIVNYGFKSGGRLAGVYVETGDRVKSGDKLVELDKQDLLYAAKAAEYQMNSAKAQYEKAVNGASSEEIKQIELSVKKAKEAYEHAADLYNKMKVLYENGAVSTQELNGYQLDMDTKKSSLEGLQAQEQQTKNGARAEDINAVKAQFEAAEVNLEIQQSLLKDSVIYAKEEGTVVDVLFQENELVAQGYPVVVLRSNVWIVNAGISENDLNKVTTGTEAIIDVDGITAKGAITNISQVPDSATRAYNAEITIDNGEYRLGAIAKVRFDIGKTTGILIPITSIFSNGEDYVYIVKDGRAFKRTVEIIKNNNDNVLVKGLQPGEQVIVSGMKNLNDGAQIKIAE